MSRTERAIPSFPPFGKEQASLGEHLPHVDATCTEEHSPQVTCHSRRQRLKRGNYLMHDHSTIEMSASEPRHPAQAGLLLVLYPHGTHVTRAQSGTPRRLGCHAHCGGIPLELPQAGPRVYRHPTPSWGPSRLSNQDGHSQEVQLGSPRSGRVALSHPSRSAAGPALLPTPLPTSDIPGPTTHSTGAPASLLSFCLTADTPSKGTGKIQGAQRKPWSLASSRERGFYICPP